VTQRSRRWRESNKAYETELERERVTVRHRRECVRVVRNVGEQLDVAGLSCDPRFFGDSQLNYLLVGPWRNLKPNGKAYNFCLLNRFLKSRNNTTVERARLRFDRTPQRPKLALTRDERVRLLDSARRAGIVPYGMIVLMLTMGLRPSEVRRLTVEQAIADPLVFIGKRKGIEQGFGKVRKVPWHPLYRELLPELLAHRRQQVGDSECADPGFLFCHVAPWDMRSRDRTLWAKKGDLIPWSKAWMDRQFIAPVFEDAKVHAPFNLNYRARRTFGRVARLEQNHPIEKVARLMGHSDPRTTVVYLGLTEDDDRAVIDSTRESYGAQLGAPAVQRKGGRIRHAG
jgi:integrase